MFVFRVDVRVSCSCFVLMFVFRVRVSCFVFRVRVSCFVFRVRVRVVTYWCGAIRVRVVFVLHVSCSC